MKINTMGKKYFFLVKKNQDFKMQSISANAKDANVNNLMVNQTLVVGKLVASSILADTIDTNRIRLRGVELDATSTTTSTSGSTTSNSANCKITAPGALNSIVTVGPGQDIQSSGSTLTTAGVLNLDAVTGQLQIDSVPMVKTNSTKTCIAVGANANGLAGAASDGNVSIGQNAGSISADTTTNIAIGASAMIIGQLDGAIVIGSGARSASDNGIAIGGKSDCGDATTGNANIAIGYDCRCTQNAATNNNILIGSSNLLANNSVNNIVIANANITGAATTNGLTIGNTASNISVNYGMAIGQGAKTSDDQSISIGNQTNNTALQSVAVGANSTCESSNSVSLGANNTMNGLGLSNNNIIVGQGNTIGSNVNDSIIVGTGSSITDNTVNCIVLGSGQAATPLDNDRWVLGLPLVLGDPGAITHHMRIRVNATFYHLPLVLIP